MAGRYDHNYTERGYLLNYRKGERAAPYKNWVLQFKIELDGIDPAIWRRIQIPAEYNFWDLHVAIQDAMGWLDYHLHHFEIKGKSRRSEEHIGIPDFERISDSKDVYPGWEIAVMNHFNELGVTARYLYDYGDSWQHTVRLEGYLVREKNTVYPVCLGGERACPREDCGGVYGYYTMLKTLANPEDDDYEMMRMWAGEDWDPERFEPGAVVFDNPRKRWQKAFLR